LKYPLRSARADHRWIPPRRNPREKLEAWLRYYDDLNLGEFFVDRRLWGSVPSNCRWCGRNKLRLRRHLGNASGSDFRNSEYASCCLPVVQAASLFEAIDRVEGDHSNSSAKTWANARAAVCMNSE